MVTTPVLSVEPAAMVRVVFDVIVKSPLSAGDTADAETSTVTSSEQGLLREAVTLADPPFSLIESELSSSVSVGVASSSVIVGVTAAGSIAPSAFEAAPYMEIVLSGASVGFVDGAHGQRVGTCGGTRLYRQATACSR